VEDVEDLVWMSLQGKTERRETYRSPFWPFQVFGLSGRGASGANFAQALLVVRKKVGRLERILREAALI
jgi:hypothetical protein